MVLRTARAALEGPGPRTLPQALLLAAKGFCMGAADIVPGVSGGTIAFITGIYWELVAAIRSFDLGFVRRMLRLDIAGALSGVHLRFLVPLLTGILAALAAMSRVVGYLLAVYPLWIWSFFFGLIAASILVVGREAGLGSVWNWVSLALGAAVAFVVVGLIPADTPETLFFLFLCGALAICAMILPGISGAFILVLLGKYEYLTQVVLKNPLEPANLLVILVFGAGCGLGLAGFSRVLNYLLGRWHALTVSALTGFMIGSLRKIWPWKQVLETRTVGRKIFVIREANVLPESLDRTFFLALGCMVLGLVVVLLLDYVSRRRQRISDARQRDSDDAPDRCAA